MISSFRELLWIVLGALLLLAAGSWTLDRPGAAAGSREQVIEILVAGGSLGQTITTEAPGLNQVRFWLRPDPQAPPSDPQTPLRLNIYYADFAGPALQRVEQPLSARTSDGAVDFRFPPLRAPSNPYVLTATLLLELSTPQLPPGEVIEVLGGPDSYPAGSAYYYAQPQPAVDLAFATTYRVRPVDIVWPISHMAAGRPGLFAWPPLYLLLPYAVAVTVGITFRRIWIEVVSER
jgi:hypothetical protein